MFPFNNGTKQKCLMVQNLHASLSHMRGGVRAWAGGEHRAFSRQMKRGQTADWPQRMEATSDRMAARFSSRESRRQCTRGLGAHADSHTTRGKYLRPATYTTHFRLYNRLRREIHLSWCWHKWLCISVCSKKVTTFNVRSVVRQIRYLWCDSSKMTKVKLKNLSYVLEWPLRK